VDRQHEGRERLVRLVDEITALSRTVATARFLRSWAIRFHRNKQLAANVLRQGHRHVRRLRMGVMRVLHERVRTARRHRRILQHFLPAERVHVLARSLAHWRVAVARHHKIEEVGRRYTVLERRQILRAPFQTWQALRAEVFASQMRSALDGWYSNRPSGVRFLLNRRKRQRRKDARSAAFVFRAWRVGIVRSRRLDRLAVLIRRRRLAAACTGWAAAAAWRAVRAARRRRALRRMGAARRRAALKRWRAGVRLEQDGRHAERQVCDRLSMSGPCRGVGGGQR
jgi:hypothetical protein